MWVLRCGSCSIGLPMYMCAVNTSAMSTVHIQYSHALHRIKISSYLLVCCRPACFGREEMSRALHDYAVSADRIRGLAPLHRLRPGGDHHQPLLLPREKVCFDVHSLFCSLTHPPIHAFIPFPSPGSKCIIKWCGAWQPS
jgi:hypothetical protein